MNEENVRADLDIKWSAASRNTLYPGSANRID